MDTVHSAPQGPATHAEQAIAEMRGEREATLKAFLGLSEAECHEQIEWRTATQSVNQRLQAFTGHLIDHQQHLLRLLFARGRGISEPEFLMMKAQAALAEFEVMVLALSDEDFAAQGPNEGDWSAAQILEHVLKTERSHREKILAGIEAVVAAREPGAS